LFNKPSKNDFVRMLMNLIEESQVKAGEKASEVQRNSKKRVNPSAGYSEALKRALLPIHKDLVARTMELAVDVARRSGLDLDDLCTTAQNLLKSHVSAMANLTAQAPLVSQTIQAGLVGAAAELFTTQIIDGLRSLRVGYIRERSIAMPPEETVQAKALRILRLIYERTRGSEGGIDIQDVWQLLGMSEEDVKAGWTYLTDKHLITTFNIPTVARINAHGVDAIEAAQLQPDKTTPIFPSVTYNVIIHGTGAGSQVNVATSGSSQVSRVSQTDPAVLREFIDGVRLLVQQTEGLLSKAGLSSERQQEVAMLLTELRKGTEATKPDTSQLRSGLESLKHVMEHGAGHVVGMGVIAGVEKLLVLAHSIGLM
jgi:hypothetical protein